MDLKEEMAKAKAAEAAKKDVAEAVGKDQFTNIVANQASGERIQGYLGAGCPTAPPAWSADEEDQLITYVRSCETLGELMLKYPNRSKWEVMDKLQQLVHDRVHYAELKKKLR